MASSGEKTIALIKEFRALPEYDLYMSLKGFSISLYIFNQNYAELNAMIEFLANNPEAEKFMDARNRDRLNNLLDEAIRLLHNFVAAAMSLVDHTRNIYDKLYSKTGNFPDYQERINIEFANDPLVQFVHCLRQYCQHYKAPNISIKFSWKTGDEKLKKTIFLLKNDLKAFDSWNANAKKVFGFNRRTGRYP